METESPHESRLVRYGVPLQFGPLNEHRSARRTEPGSGMEKSVLCRRHFILRELSDNIIQHNTPTLCRILPPEGEIEVFPALLHVTGDQPGGRREAAVPGPACPEGMAVQAS